MRILSLPLLFLGLSSAGCGSLDELLPDGVPAPPPGSHPPASPPTELRKGPSEAVLSRERVVEIELTVDQADWEVLRHQGRGPAELFAGTVESRKPFEYTTFSADAVIDGQPFSGIGLRKAGYFDLSSFEPELELDFAWGARFSRSGNTLRRMALKNDINDPTLTRECLALDLFRAAGYPASRCNFARVSVNGQLLGHYVHIEAVDERMLKRNFGDGSGNLYRGQQADFFEVTLPLILNQDPSRGDERENLHALLAALDSDSSEWLDLLGAVLDLDAFRDFWALETLLGHWDGYTNALNNFYLYQDPATDEFVFLPWDLDQAFVGTPGFGPPYEITAYYTGRIANRLYADESQRSLFRQRLSELNDELWQVPALIEQAEALHQLVPGDEAAFAQHLEYLTTHGEELRTALLEPAPEVPASQPFEPVEGDECAGLLTAVSGTFSTVVSNDIYEPDAVLGSASLSTSPDGQTIDTPAFSVAGPDQVIPNSGSVYVATELSDGTWLGFALIMPEVNFVPGVHPLHSLETFIPATRMTPFDVGSIVTYGFVSDGSVTLEEAGLELGQAVSGSFSGTLVQQSCSQVPVAEAL